MNNPIISAVIPTRNRPDLVVRAARSALAQTYEPIEVIVVIDGPDRPSQVAIEAISDHRLKIISLKETVGGAEARNIGAAQSHGEWVAFLDDDDEWMPEKIAREFSAASACASALPLLCTQVLARTPEAEFIWPENAPRKPYSEYLLVRSRLGYGEGLMQTSTLMAKRELVEKVPFRKGLRKHQDWDWVLRCAEYPGVEIIYVPQPLSIWNVDQSRARLSHESAWVASWNWIRESESLVTSLAYSSFIATYVAPQAAAEKSWRSFFPLLKELFHGGMPRLRDAIVFLGAWFVPPQLRDTLRGMIHTQAAIRSHSAEKPSVS